MGADRGTHFPRSIQGKQGPFEGQAASAAPSITDDSVRANGSTGQGRPGLAAERNADAPAPKSGPVIPLAPIFPLSTIPDLEAELAVSDRALERLGESPFVDLDQLNAYRQRLQKWRDRIACQLQQMRAE